MREDQPGGQLRPAGLPRGQALPVLHVRGVQQPGRPQHALHQHRPGAPGGAGPPPLPCVAAQRRRPGGAPGPDASGGRRFQARGRRHRSDHEPAHRRDRQRAAIDADPHYRFLQGPPTHHPPDEPDSRDPPEPGDLGRTGLLAGRHLDPGERDRVRRRAEPRALHPEIARHGPLEPGPRVPPDGPGDRVDRRLPWHGRGPGRGGPRGPDDPR